MIIEDNDFITIESTPDGFYQSGKSGVRKVLQSKDSKVFIIFFENNRQLLGINTRDSFFTYYPLNEVEIKKPITAVLMDLDGTTLYSEEFWISVIEKTVQTISNNLAFSFSEEDIPFVSGHSVSEHLLYCIKKFCPSVELTAAINTYFDVSREQLQMLINGQIEGLSIKPATYLKEFLSFLVERGIKVGLVSSGLYEKAYPEIWSVCDKLDIGKPEETYNSIITAGYPLKDHHVGTLGELSAKPHPWLYLESAIVGLGLSFEERSRIIGIEDSAAGIYALRAAGIPAIGLKHGNIISSGAQSLCVDICNGLEEIQNKYF